MKHTVEIQAFLPVMFTGEVEVTDLPETATKEQIIEAAKAKWEAEEVVMEFDPMMNETTAKYRDLGTQADEVEFRVAEQEVVVLPDGKTDVEISPEKY